LLVACFNGKLETALKLLEKGANPAMSNEEGLTPLCAAASNGHVNIVKLLLPLPGVNVNCQMTLNQAAQKGYAKVVELLLEAGASNADGSFECALLKACVNGHTKVVKVLLKHVTNLGPQLLLESSALGFVDIVELLLSHQCSPNADDHGDFPLYHAARHGNVKIVQLLLDYGADINKVDSQGVTALMVAICNSQVSVIDLLLQKRVNVNMTNGKGWPILFLAITANNETVLKMILERKPYINYTLSTGV
jgi:ankyrin repeat protein